jgi:hypothetical protein
VSVENLRVVLGKPVVLRVVLNGCGYSEHMRNACSVYFRVVDSNGSPVPDAALSPTSSGNPVETDKFGRWQGLVRGSAQYVFTKRGFTTTMTNVECHDDEEIDREVIMGRVGKFVVP